MLQRLPYFCRSQRVACHCGAGMFRQEGEGAGGSGTDSDDAASDPAVAETGCCSAGAVQPDADGVPVAGAAQPDSESDHENIAESTIALDPLHDVAPVRMMQALQGTIDAVTKHAAQIARNERTKKVADKDGVLQVYGPRCAAGCTILGRKWQYRIGKGSRWSRCTAIGES